MWAVFQLQDILGTSDGTRRQNPQEERINVPAISQHYWKYRMHSAEQLIKEKAFNEDLKETGDAASRSIIFDKLVSFHEGFL